MNEKADKEFEKAYTDEGAPRLVRIYDNGGRTADRYTVVFIGNIQGVDQVPGLAMDETPFHPQGFGQHCEWKKRPDTPSYLHLGKRIKFSELPADCRRLVMLDYIDYWPDNREGIHL